MATDIPLVVLGTSYLTGTAIYLAILAWLLSDYIHDTRQGRLREVVKKFIWRSLAVGVLVSATMVLQAARIEKEGWIVIFPETAFFICLFGLYALSGRRQGCEWSRIFFALTLGETGKTALLVFSCGAIWGLSFLMTAGSPPSVKGSGVFLVTAFWTILPFMLLHVVNRKIKSFGSDKKNLIRTEDILWPLLLSLLFLTGPSLLVLLMDAMASAKADILLPLKKV